MSTAVRALFSGEKKKKPPLPPKPRASSPEQSRPPRLPHKPAFLSKLLRSASRGSTKGTSEKSSRLRRSDGEEDENTEESADFKDIDFSKEIFDFSSPVDNQLPVIKTVETVAATPKPDEHGETLPAIDFSLDNISLDEPTIRILLSNPDFMATIAAMDEEAVVATRLNSQTDRRAPNQEEEDPTPVASPQPTEEPKEDFTFATGDAQVEVEAEAEWEDAEDEVPQISAPIQGNDSYYEPVAKPGEALMAKLALEMADYQPPKKAQVGDPFAWRQMSLERFKGFGECHVGQDPPPTAFDRIERDYNAIEAKLSRCASPSESRSLSPGKPPVPPRPRARSDNRPALPPPRKPKSLSTSVLKTIQPNNESSEELGRKPSDEIYENDAFLAPEVFEGERNTEDGNEAPSDEAAFFERVATVAEVVVVSAEEVAVTAERAASEVPEPKPRSRSRKRFPSADAPRTFPRRLRKKVEEEDGAVTKAVDGVRVWIPRRSRSFHSADEIRKKIDLQAQSHLRIPRKGRESTGNLSPSAAVYSVVKKDYSRIWKPCKRDTEGHVTQYGPVAKTPPPPTPPSPYVFNADGEDEASLAAEAELEALLPETEVAVQSEVQEIVELTAPEALESETVTEAVDSSPQMEKRVETEKCEETAAKVEPQDCGEKRTGRPLPAPPPPPRPRHRSKKTEPVPVASRSRDAGTQMESEEAVVSAPNRNVADFTFPELHVVKLRVFELEASRITAGEIEASRIRGHDVDGVQVGRRNGEGGAGGGVTNLPSKSWSDKESQTEESNRPKTTDRGSGPNDRRHQQPEWEVSSRTTDSQAYETCAETIHGSEAGGDPEEEDREAAKRSFLLGWMESANPYADSEGSLVGSDTTEAREATPPPPADLDPRFKVPAGGVPVLPGIAKLPRRSSDASGGLRRSNAQRRKTTTNLLPVETSFSAPNTPRATQGHLGRGGAAWRFDGVTRSDSSGSSADGGTVNKLKRNTCRTWVDEGEAPGNLADNDNDVSDGHVSRVLRNTVGGEDSDAEGSATIKQRLSALFGGASAKENRRRNAKSTFYLKEPKEEPKLEQPVDLLKKITMVTEAVTSYIAEVADDDLNNNNNDDNGSRLTGEPQNFLELPQDGVHKRASSEESAVVSDPSLSEEHRLPKGNSFEMSDEAPELQPRSATSLSLPAVSSPVPVTQANSNRIVSFRESSECSSDEDDEDDDSSDAETTGSSSSRSASVCSEERAGGHRKHDKAFMVARELMTSECVFVDVLRLLNEDFRNAVYAANKEQGHTVIPEDVFAQIMGSLPQLQSLNEDLLGDFIKRIDKWDEIGLIADVIARKGPFLKLYSSYFRSYENMISVMDEACKKYAQFARVVKEFEMSDRCQKLALKHYLVKPVQRIPQYRLLLQEYLKKLDKTSADYQNAENALRIVSEVADHANQTLKIGDNYAKMLEIQNKAPTFEIVKPGRVFVKEGELLKLSRKGLQPRFFVLFNDCLLHTTMVSPTHMKIHHDFAIAGLKVTVPNSEDYENEFSIISISRSFTISARSQKEKEEWVAALNGVIDENAKRRGTFVNARLQTKSKEDSMKLETLGRQAPVWIADSRVTMCQLCASYFTLTFRRHHCRACGKVVCSLCSANRVPLEYLDGRTSRVCDDCFVVMQKAARANGGEAQGSTRERQLGNERTKVPLQSRPRQREPSKKRKNLRRLVPNALQEVHANDEGSSASGYLHKSVKKSWKKMWFVVKDNVLYSYMASEDVVALESIPLLGFNVVRVDAAFEGIDAKVIIRLEHTNHPPLTFYAGSITAAERWRKAMEDATKLE